MTTRNDVFEIDVKGLKEFIHQHWHMYASDGTKRLFFNGLGDFKVEVKQITRYMGRDIDEAVRQFNKF